MLATPSPDTYIYKTASGCEMRADVYRPGSRANGAAILWLHGGALIFGARDDIEAYQLGAYLLAGYTVVSADYRLAPETQLPAILDDLSDALAWVRREGPRLYSVDPERVAVVGHSAGAYLALTAGYWTSPRPRAIVSFYGYGDITGAWYARPDAGYRSLGLIPSKEALLLVGQDPISSDAAGKRLPFYIYCRQHGVWPQYVTGHDPLREPNWSSAYCPVRNVSLDYPPTLLIHGVEDTDVPHVESVAMDAELARWQVPHGFLSLPGRGHVFDAEDGAAGDPVVIGVFDQVLEFLGRYCSGVR